MKKIILILLLPIYVYPADVVDTLNVADTEFRDNWMMDISGNEDYNEGSHTAWNIGEWESGSATFRQWFYCYFPSNVSAIEACTLKYTVIDPEVAADSLHVFRIAINVDPTWEGNNVDANADVGEMSWNARSEQSPGTDSAWNTAGCKGSGTDYINIILGAGDVSGAAHYKIELDSATIDSITTNELNNYGFLVLANNQETPSSRCQIGSTENASEGNRPYIILAYDTTTAATTKYWKIRK
jgi:hypothetical protein